MPSIGNRCHELIINDGNSTWRIIYRIDADAIVIAEVFQKKTQQTPKQVIENSRRRLRHYDEL
jgi:phage-related protein